MDPFDFPGDGPAPPEGLVQLCKKISSTKSKDALIKGLKQLVSILESAPQDVEALGRGGDELPRTVASLLHHSDKDVKLYVAVCVVNMLRIWAPDTPFDDEPDNLEVRRGAKRAQQACYAMRSSTHAVRKVPPTTFMLNV
jgi:hypothetical protein